MSGSDPKKLSKEEPLTLDPSLEHSLRVPLGSDGVSDAGGPPVPSSMASSGSIHSFRTTSTLATGGTYMSEREVARTRKELKSVYELVKSVSKELSVSKKECKALAKDNKRLRGEIASKTSSIKTQWAEYQKNVNNLVNAIQSKAADDSATAAALQEISAQGLSLELQNAKKEAEEKTEALLVATGERDKMAHALHTLRGKYESSKKEASDLKKSLEESRERSSSVSNDSVPAMAAWEAAQAENAALTKAKKKLETQVEELKKELESSKQKSSLAVRGSEKRLEETRSEYRQLIDEAETRAAQAQRELGSIQSTLREVQKSSELAHKQVADLVATVQAREETIEQLRKEAEVGASSHRRRLSEGARESAVLQTEVSERDAKIEELTVLLEQAQAEKRAAEENAFAAEAAQRELSRQTFSSMTQEQNTNDNASNGKSWWSGKKKRQSGKVAPVAPPPAEEPISPVNLPLTPNSAHPDPSVSEKLLKLEVDNERLASENASLSRQTSVLSVTVENLQDDLYETKTTMLELEVENDHLDRKRRQLKEELARSTQEGASDPEVRDLKLDLLDLEKALDETEAERDRARVQVRRMERQLLEQTERLAILEALGRDKRMLDDAEERARAATVKLAISEQRVARMQRKLAAAGEQWDEEVEPTGAGGGDRHAQEKSVDHPTEGPESRRNTRGQKKGRKSSGGHRGSDDSDKRRRGRYNSVAGDDPDDEDEDDEDDDENDSTSSDDEENEELEELRIGRERKASISAVRRVHESKVRDALEKTLSVNSDLAEEVDQLRLERDDLLVQSDSLQNRVDAMSNDRQALRARLAEAKETVAELEKELEEARSRSSSVSSKEEVALQPQVGADPLEAALALGREITNQLEESQARVEELEGELEHLQEEKDAIEAELRDQCALREQRDELLLQTDSLQNQVTTVGEDRESLRERLADARKAVVELEQELNESRSRSNSLSETEEEKSKELEEALERVDVLEKQCKKLNEDLASREAALDDAMEQASLTEQVLDQMRDQVELMLEERDKAAKAANDAMSRAERLRDEMNVERGEKETTMEELADVRAELQTTTERLADAQSNEMSKEAELSRVKEALDKVQWEAEEAKKKLADVEEDLSCVQRELDSAKARESALHSELGLSESDSKARIGSLKGLEKKLSSRSFSKLPRMASLQSAGFIRVDTEAVEHAVAPGRKSSSGSDGSDGSDESIVMVDKKAGKDSVLEEEDLEPEDLETIELAAEFEQLQREAFFSTALGVKLVQQTPVNWSIADLWSAARYEGVHFSEYGAWIARVVRKLVIDPTYVLPGIDRDAGDLEPDHSPRHRRSTLESTSSRKSFVNLGALRLP